MTHLCRFSAPVCRTFVLSLLTTNQPTNQRTQTIVYQNEYLKLHFCFPLLFCPPSKNYTIYTRPKIVAPVAGHMDSKFERYSDPHELRRTHRHHIPSPPVCVCVCVPDKYVLWWFTTLRIAYDDACLSASYYIRYNNDGKASEQATQSKQ